MWCGTPVARTWGPGAADVVASIALLLPSRSSTHSRQPPDREPGQCQRNTCQDGQMEDWGARNRRAHGEQSQLIQMKSRRETFYPQHGFWQRDEKARKIDHGQIEQVHEGRRALARAPRADV